ncbi:radial spoke head 10 -like protein [Labeo rohita]|uniref:Radial spoke head 10-like protein n=1 Tax=Labeo rohita TaxID=84645 RepID=A0A498LFM4_LABRO|nr:radial spoke head 10 -like protein [Labeo rohita]
MAKGYKMKSSNRSTPEPTFSKVLGESSTSTLVSESVAEPDDVQDSSSSTVCSASAVSLPTNDHQPKHEHDQCRKVPILHHIIVERYEGEKSGDMFHGEGVAYFQGGHVYKGDFKLNVPMGHGTYTWLDSSTYEGEVHKGVRHGVGIYKCAKTKTVYRGQWYLGKRQGQGIMYYNQAATSWYKGEWMNNCREGWGKRCYPSGNVYEGQWKNNVRHGEGTMRWIQLNQQYCGQWVNGIQDGKGTHTWFRKRVPYSQYPRMNEYTGEFAQGMRHGQGQFFYASGAVYCGEWKHDKKHGQVEFAVLRHIGLLREIYSFYSSLGHEQSSDKILPLTHLQFSRFLMDCKVHQHGITLAQMDRLISGPLFCHPVQAALAFNYSDRCWEIYQALCKVNSIQSDPTLTVRQFVWMLKDLCLYDSVLTVSKVLEILSVDSPAIYDGTYSNLDLEISFLEFFEALLGCAEVKGQKIQTDLENQTETNHQDDTVLSSLQSSLSEEMERNQSPVLAFKETELKNWMQKTQQFFTQTFFPAYEHSVKLQEERIRLREKRLALAEAEKARYIEQQEAKEKQEEDGDVPNDVNNSPSTPKTPVTSTTSVVSKQSITSGSKKK